MSVHTAYAAAEAAIAKAIAEGADSLDLSGEEFRELETLPPEIAKLTGLQVLDLRNTEISDLTPLRGMTAMMKLGLGGTQISDLTPLQGMTAMTTLDLDNTQISDLMPLQRMTAMTTLRLNRTDISDLTPLQDMTAMTTLWLNDTLISDLTPLQDMAAMTRLNLDGNSVSDLRPVRTMRSLADTATFADGILFLNIPALALDPELARIAEIQGSSERGATLLAYLDKIGDDWPPVPDAPADRSSAPAYILEEDQPLRSVDISPGDFDEDQQALQDDVQEKAARLIEAVGDSNEYARLGQSAKAYQDQVRKPLNNIALKRLWSAANSLRQAANADGRAEAGARHIDMLPPNISAALHDLVETHGLFYMGFPEGREIEADMRKYLHGDRDADLLAAAQIVANALQGADGVLDPEDQAALQEDSDTANAADADGAMAEESLVARLWNMIGTAGRKVWVWSKTPAKWGTATIAAHDVVQFLLGKETVIMKFLTAAQGAAASWFPQLMAAIRLALGL